ncbi:tripeptidyl-peptidase sed2 [Apiospora saccharicola]
MSSMRSGTAKVIETFAPSQESVDVVTKWLVGAGMDPNRIQLSKGRNWLDFNATVGELEKLLKTQYFMFRHSRHGKHQIACDEYHHIGHERLNNRVSMDTEQVNELKKRGLDSGGRPSTGIQGSGLDGWSPKQGDFVENAMMTLNDCDKMLTLDCIRALYKIPKGDLAAKNNSLGIVEYTPQAFLQSDLDLFNDQFEPKLKGKGPDVDLIDNAVVQTQNQSFQFNGESALDLQYAMGLVFPQQAKVFQVGDLVRGASFGNLLDAIDGSFCDDKADKAVDSIDNNYPDKIRCGGHTATNVISTSYGYNEADLTARYEQRQCAEYMKLALQGVSMIFSSGDSGVAGNGHLCRDPASGDFNDGSKGLFTPAFPSTCPYITSVGATQIVPGKTVADAESACEETILSGGGFSNVFAMPDYQSKVVAAYFNNSAPPYSDQQFNNSRAVRGYPDVSANGARYVTAVDGKFSLSFGTSASAPVFAAMLNLINEKRFAAGKAAVGFVNPVLYAHPEVMNDITNGTNAGCGTKGFSAVKGWDPITGLGTPNFEAMEKLFLSLP